MRKLLVILLTLVSFCCKANEIDKLKTLDDVKAFLKKHSENKKIDYFKDSKADTSTKYSKTKFLKIDLNNDGLTDLIVNGTYLLVVLDNGNDNFAFHFIDGGAFAMRQYVLNDIVTSGEQPLLIVKNYDEDALYEKRQVKPVYDTLIIKYGGLVEYYTHEDDVDISKLSFSTTMCFGTCPVFDLHIASNGYAEYDAQQFNPETGKFQGKIDNKTLVKLLALIKYLNLRSLANNYKVNWTDDQTCHLSVKYKNGVTKSISDYGLIGTFGLHTLYELLFSLRQSQEWTEVTN